VGGVGGLAARSEGETSQDGCGGSDSLRKTRMLIETSLCGVGMMRSAINRLSGSRLTGGVED